ncbi:MAG TPA: isoprenylcysteine carboxylmethyltransferase family protein [Thermodesulfovibrionales bacterium]|nr:isoprenylcysteine carboxylmethyltransferase family protein [Thermodesulfovibrionales bacterium]
MLIYLQIIAGIWIVFMAFLFIPALWASTPVERRSIQYVKWSIILALIVVAIVVFLSSYKSKTLILRIIPDSQLAGIIGIILTFIGLGFSTWARLHLGKNWSSMVEVKVGHRLVRTGPYRIVRNPMYTGFIISFVGAAIAFGQVLGFIVLTIVFVSIWVKIKAEEKILLEKFGVEYMQYKKDVRAAIIPWVV